METKLKDWRIEVVNLIFHVLTTLKIVLGVTKGSPILFVMLNTNCKPPV